MTKQLKLLFIFLIVFQTTYSQNNYISIPVECRMIDYFQTRWTMGTGIKYQRLFKDKIAIGISSSLLGGLNNSNSLQLKNQWANELSFTYFRFPAFKKFNFSALLGYNFFSESQLLSSSTDRSLKDRFHFGFGAGYNIPFGKVRLCPTLGTGAMINFATKSPNALYYELKINIGYVW
jgi:hypothetical protein